MTDNLFNHYLLLPFAPLALYLPWVEIVAGIAAVFDRTRHGALTLLLTLSLVFTAAVGSAWARGLDIDCACFGHAISSDVKFALARDVVLGAVLAWLFRHETARRR